jgi:hypothetical protein
MRLAIYTISINFANLIPNSRDYFGHTTVSVYRRLVLVHHAVNVTEIDRILKSENMI